MKNLLRLTALFFAILYNNLSATDSVLQPRYIRQLSEHVDFLNNMLITTPASQISQEWFTDTLKKVACDISHTYIRILGVPYESIAMHPVEADFMGKSCALLIQDHSSVDSTFFDQEKVHRFELPDQFTEPPFICRSPKTVSTMSYLKEDLFKGFIYGYIKDLQVLADERNESFQIFLSLTSPNQVDALEAKYTGSLNLNHKDPIIYFSGPGGRRFQLNLNPKLNQERLTTKRVQKALSKMLLNSPGEQATLLIPQLKHSNPCPFKIHVHPFISEDFYSVSYIGCPDPHNPEDLGVITIQSHNQAWSSPVDYVARQSGEVDMQVGFRIVFDAFFDFRKDHIDYIFKSKSQKFNNDFSLLTEVAWESMEESYNLYFGQSFIKELFGILKNEDLKQAYTTAKAFMPYLRKGTKELESKIYSETIKPCAVSSNSSPFSSPREDTCQMASTLSPREDTFQHLSKEYDRSPRDNNSWKALNTAQSLPTILKD